MGSPCLLQFILPKFCYPPAEVEDLEVVWVYWPIYGQDNEVAFTWSSHRSTRHAIAQLTGFNGTLLTDGQEVLTGGLHQTRS